MAERNVQRLDGILEQLFEGRPLGADLLADEAEWVNPHDAIEPGTRRGAAGFNDAIRSVFAAWDEVRFEVERVIDQGEDVIVLGVLHGRVHGPGMEIDSPHGQVWTFRDGRVIRMQWFNTHDETLEAWNRDDIALVESAFEAWNRDDIARFAGHTAEDVVWVEVSGRPEGPGGERHGRDRLRRSLEELFEAWESYSLELERVEAAGNRVLALVREKARGRTSGVEVESRWGYLITVENGEIARVEAYRDPEQAVEASHTRGT